MKVLRALRWMVLRGAWIALVAYATVGGAQWALNLSAFMTWIYFASAVLFFGGVGLLSRDDLPADVGQRSVPKSLNVMASVLISGLFAVDGRFALATAYLIGALLVELAVERAHSVVRRHESRRDVADAGHQH